MNGFPVPPAGPPPSASTSNTQWWVISVVGAVLFAISGVAAPQYALRLALVFAVLGAVIVATHAFVRLLQRVKSDSNSAFLQPAVRPDPSLMG